MEKKGRGKRRKEKGRKEGGKERGRGRGKEGGSFGKDAKKMPKRCQRKLLYSPLLSLERLQARSRSVFPGRPRPPSPSEWSSSWICCDVSLLVQSQCLVIGLERARPKTGDRIGGQPAQVALAPSWR